MSDNTVHRHIFAPNVWVWFRYRNLLKKLMPLAKQERVVLVLEGGYNLEAISASTVACVEELIDHLDVGANPPARKRTHIVPPSDQMPGDDASTVEDNEPRAPTVAEMEVRPVREHAKKTVDDVIDAIRPYWPFLRANEDDISATSEDVAVTAEAQQHATGTHGTVYGKGTRSEQALPDAALPLSRDPSVERAMSHFAGRRDSFDLPNLDMSADFVLASPMDSPLIAGPTAHSHTTDPNNANASDGLARELNFDGEPSLAGLSPEPDRRDVIGDLSPGTDAIANNSIMDDSFGDMGLSQSHDQLP